MPLRTLAMTSAALALLSGPAFADFNLTILHINDFHSRIEPINKYDSTCSASDDAEGKCFGGAARVATIINDTRAQLIAEGKNVLVLDAGDQFQGSLFYTTYKGAAEAEVMEKIGFDVMAVGNHEFDDGPAALAAFAEKVSFPIISSNLDLTKSAELSGKIGDHVVLEVGGQKVGIISALATDTVDTSSPGPDVVFADEIEALTAAVTKLEAQGVQHIIALTHVGYNLDQRIAAQVPGIDAVVGGHSHTYLSATDDKATGLYPTMVANPTGAEVPVVTAYAYGKYMGHLDLAFDDAGKVVSAGGDVRVIDASITPNAEIAARVAEMGGPIADLKAKVVAEASGDIDGDRTTCRQVECQMGNLVSDAMLDRVRDQGVTIAIQNGGGLRASIQGGLVTMGDVLTVLPFQNTLATFQVTGATVVAALENGVSEVADGAGRFAQVAGLKYTFDPALPAGARVSDVMVEEHGVWSAIDPAKIYGVVSNNYVRSGGDGFRMFATDSINAYDFGPDLADVLAEYMIKNAPYQPYLDGRITRR